MSKRPWQFVVLATLCFMQAATLVMQNLHDLLVRASPVAVQSRLDQGFEGLGGESTLDAIYEDLALRNFVFTTMAVLTFMFGFLLYRSEYLPAVRLTGAIYFAIGTAGQILFVTGSADTTPFETGFDDIFQNGFTALLFLGFVSLFFGKPAQWANEHRDG